MGPLQTCLQIKKIQQLILDALILEISKYKND